MRYYQCLHNQSYSAGNYSIIPIRDEDRYLIMKWRNEQLYHLRQADPLTAPDQDRYFNEVVAQLFEKEKPGQILFSYLESGKCIGYGGLVHINWRDKNAEISFIIDTSLETGGFSKHWGIYLSMIEQVAFNDLGFHKLYVYAFDLRPRLYTVLEENGYIHEATLRDHVCIESSFRNVVIHRKIHDEN